MREEGSDSGHEQLGFLNKERGILVLIVAVDSLHNCHRAVGTVYK